MLVLNRNDHLEHMLENLGGRAHRVHLVHDLVRIARKHRARLAIVDLEALADHLLIGVVDAVLLERAAAHAHHHRLDVGAHEVEHGEHLEMLLERLRLHDIARDPVEHQQVDIRLVDRQHGLRVHVLAPHLDRELVRHKLAARRVRHELGAKLRRHVERAENIAAGKVEEPRDLAEDLALRALAGAWGTEEKDRLESSRRRLGCRV